MGLLYEVLLTLLCSLGLAMLGGLLVGRLLRPIPGEGIWILVPGRKEGGKLEREVRAVMWLRSLGLLDCPVAIVDVDLTREGRELAFRLIQRWNGLVLWPGDHLSELLKTEEAD